MSGSVTSPSGSFASGSLAGLLDAYTGTWSGYEDPWGPPPPDGPIQAQWQHWVLLSATAGPCSRVGSGLGFGPGEITLRFLFVGTIPLPPPGQPGGHADTYPPAADLPLTFEVDGDPWVTTSDGVMRNCKAIAMKAKANGAAGTDKYATSGTVTFTRMDADQYEGHYDDVNFGSGPCSGSFVAPWCGTAP